MVAILAICIFLSASQGAQAQTGTCLGFERNHYPGDANLKGLNPATSPDPFLGAGLTDRMGTGREWSGSCPLVRRRCTILAEPGNCPLDAFEKVSWGD